MIIHSVSETRLWEELGVRLQNIFQIWRARKKKRLVEMLTMNGTYYALKVHWEYVSLGFQARKIQNKNKYFK